MREAHLQIPDRSRHRWAPLSQVGPASPFTWTTPDSPSWQIRVLSDSQSKAEAVNHVTTAVVNLVAKMLQTSPSEIDVGCALHSYGIDSQVGMEIVT